MWVIKSVKEGMGNFKSVKQGAWEKNHPFSRDTGAWEKTIIFLGTMCVSFCNTCFQLHHYTTPFSKKCLQAVVG